MTPGARAAAAIELIDAVESDRTRPADAVVAGWFRRRRYAGGGDRRAIQAILYLVLRRRAQIDWWLRQSGQRADSRARVIAALILGERWRINELDAAFDGGHYRPPSLDDSERALAAALEGRAFDDPAQPIHIKGNFPAWMEGALRAVLGDLLESELAALMCEAPVDLRVNTLKTTRREAAAMLRRAGIEVSATPFSPLGLRLPGRVNLANSPIIRDGLAEPQDESSQIAVLLVDPQPGEKVVDFCAGAGGKTLALAALMRNEGRITACDTSAARLSRAVPRLERAGTRITRTVVLEGADGLWPDAEKSGYVRVLVDAPCSGTGTWRRHPEARWRIDKSDLEDFVAAQARILDAAATLVAPGGRLVYCVCSVLPQEGEAQVADFLERRPDFNVFPIYKSWRQQLDSDCPSSDDFLRLWPGRDGTDGFFVAVVVRDGPEEATMATQ
jgi:16S rRNA (cytosine967-C5)-methyltransferase